MRLFLSLLLLVAGIPLLAQTTILHTNWQFRQVGSTIWHKAKIPGTVHTDLLSNSLIPDPFYRDNETKLQWIADEDWEYATRFDVKNNFKSFPKILLKFEGLDTYTDIFLNDSLILSTDNMFRTYTVDVKSFLKEKNNRLRIIFNSAKKITDSLAKHSDLERPCENNRHYARKAQYHFGWDWAPRYITCGIWRPVKLIYGEDEKPAKAQYAPVKLVQDKDSIGQSFYFTVNGKPTFMKGANWIPADVFLPRITKQKYRQLLLAAKEAHFNMLRVWGGGIYEDDAFYDLCDSLGIYVWQDFMFAGAMYPADSHFVENIKQEVIDNILRLRKHNCIVLWCGNNEIDEAWHNWGWQKQFNLSPQDSTKLWSDYQKFFNELLPSLVKQYDPGRAYIASSPIHGWGRQQSMTHGDSHYWGMWWGMDPISVMTKKIPRFMSEYGMQAMPDISTIRQFTLPADLDTSSVVMKIHQKHPTGFKTLNNYLQMEKIPANSFTSFITATQELQSRALATTIKAQLHSQGRCMGSLLWQFNDCWPVCSWSIVDYYGRKKKAYETVKKLFR
ncbi:beta-mannosidase B [Filimonas sp.]|nr:beta-mannosidase B [Filimonas sp.]